MPTMPGYEFADSTHPLMRERELYGCHNHDMRVPTPIEVQDGYNADGSRRMVKITTRWQDVDCGHEALSGSDKRCAGCKWRSGHGH